MNSQLMSPTNKPLSDSEERYRFLFESGSPAAVYSIDTSGVIQEFNRCAADLWGRSPVIGDTDERFCGSHQMFRPDGTHMPHDQCPMALVVAGKVSEVRNGEVVILRPDGSRITVIVNITRLTGPRGETVGAINCFYDITERSRMEQLLQQQAATLADVNRRKGRIPCDVESRAAQPSSHLLPMPCTSSKNSALRSSKRRFSPLLSVNSLSLRG